MLDKDGPHSLDYADSLKGRGVPMSRILVAMCTHVLMGSNFMSRCSDWLKDRNVRKELGAVGYPRDFRDRIRPQVEFLAAELQRSRIPFFIRAYEGNASDPAQYRNALPDIFRLVRRGSWVIMDNGGASGTYRTPW